MNNAANAPIAPPAGDRQAADVIDFMRSPASYPGAPATVEVIETHAAVVFLAGDDAYKIKKPVRLPYLDFSTLASRKAVCERELAVNRPHAPMIYLGLVPICRSADGTFQFGGKGEPVEWAVHMRRFPDDALLSSLSAGSCLEPALVDLLADRIIDYHDQAPVERSGNGYSRIMAIVDELNEAFAAAPDVIDPTTREAFARLASDHAARHRHRLDQRARRGYVRRCHGDLHLDNIVVLDGQPVLFDAIEFDEEIATIDTLYDLAFLIMDLEARSMPQEANRVMNRYVVNGADPANIAGLAVLPLFLACRAAIRAMVAITRLGQVTSRLETEIIQGEITGYLGRALGYLERGPQRMVCIGGLSGTGKTTVARQLAPQVAVPPGALHLRSDVERKLLFGVPETERLDTSAYTEDVSRTVYRRLLNKARLALMAGFSVIVDAVFLGPGERARARQIAQQTGAEFDGLWLRAKKSTMLKRVADRRADASDATVDVVEKQLTADQSPPDWTVIDAEGRPEAVAERCLAAMRVPRSA